MYINLSSIVLSLKIPEKQGRGLMVEGGGGYMLLEINSCLCVCVCVCVCVFVCVEM